MDILYITHGLGREAATGRKVAIKKIKVGQFKDGLDMSAIREVKYLRELSHPNVIAVSIVLPIILPTSQRDALILLLVSVARRLFSEDKSQPGPRVLGLGSRDDHQRMSYAFPTS